MTSGSACLCRCHIKGPAKDVSTSASLLWAVMWVWQIYKWYNKCFYDLHPLIVWSSFMWACISHFIAAPVFSYLENVYQCKTLHCHTRDGNNNEAGGWLENYRQGVTEYEKQQPNNYRLHLLLHPSSPSSPPPPATLSPLLHPLCPHFYQPHPSPPPLTHSVWNLLLPCAPSLQLTPPVSLPPHWSLAIEMTNRRLWRIWRQSRRLLRYLNTLRKTLITKCFSSKHHLNRMNGNNTVEQNKCAFFIIVYYFTFWYSSFSINLQWNKS